MELDPGRSPKEQVDAVFKRARRLRQGAHIAGSRMADAGAARDALFAIAENLDTDRVADLARLEARAREVAPRDFRLDPEPRGAPKRERRRDTRLPYRMFLAASGVRILAGRGATDNDALTCRVARPHDLWLHAKSRAGAHVIVLLDKGATCTPEALVEAAHLAAHFSDARDERIVEVQYTPRRYVRKPRGSAPGFVVVDREKVMVLRRDDELLRRLLQREVLEDPAPSRP
jgi:predicted ribosome quality control (RQC) complex YloA/Tae2 family protein